jgi:hypothetical protein
VRLVHLGPHLETLNVVFKGSKGTAQQHIASFISRWVTLCLPGQFIHKVGLKRITFLFVALVRPHVHFWIFQVENKLITKKDVEAEVEFVVEFLWAGLEGIVALNSSSEKQSQKQNTKKSEKQTGKQKSKAIG